MVDPTQIGGWSDDPEQSPQLSSEELLHLLASRISGVDPQIIGDTHNASKPLEELCSIMTEEVKTLEKIKNTLRGMFSDRQALEDAFNGVIRGAGFFFDIDRHLSGQIQHAISNYQKIGHAYNTIVRGRLTQSDDPRNLRSPSTINAVVKAMELCSMAAVLPAAITQRLSRELDACYMHIVSYNKQLTSKFVKSADDDPKNPHQMIIIRDEDELNAPAYVKIKLVDNNPVLTDMLLSLADRVPRYRERIETKGRSKRIVREVSGYAINDVADALVAAAEPRMLEYLQEPKQFFTRIGTAVEQWYKVFMRLEEATKSLMDASALQPVADNMVENDPRGEAQKIGRGAKRILNSDFDAIVQKEDDVLPENRKEKDHFKLRDQLLTLLYDAMKDIAKMDGDIDKKERHAREAIRSAVDLKSKIWDLLAPDAARMLRKDKTQDNEFYVGKQGHVGAFYFEREPTPTTKMSEVIGASFDPAKKHLDEIIHTASYPHVMRLSAPGGKVKSNILLIGPFGCGKTELARAVCADERVIGANVNVASTLTAYMHESVNNVKRVYDAAKKLHMDAREQKPVILILDEFDAWFAHGEGMYSDIDMQQIEDVFLQVLDGMEDYNGIVTMAMTNKPWMIPKGILRRFRYADIVGQLTEQERSGMLRMYIEKSLPAHPDLGQHYQAWAQRLKDAPGDVVRKVVDELHFALVPEYIRAHPEAAARLERVLQRRDLKHGGNDDKDIAWLKQKLTQYRTIMPNDVDAAIDRLLKQPPIQMQIESAREVYERADELREDMARPSGFGLKRQDKIWDRDYRG